MESKLSNPHMVADMLDKAGFEIEAARLLTDPTTKRWVKMLQWCVNHAQGNKRAIRLLTEASIVAQ